MSSHCESCESNNFTVENCERICTNCGDVQEEFADEGRLCILADNEAIVDSYRNKNYEANQRLTGRIRGETNSSETKKVISREKLLDDMRRVVKQLVKHPSAVDETMELVDSTFQAHKGRLLNNKKLGLVGACIYYLSAKHQLGISLTDICKTMSIRMKIISICLKQVRQLVPQFEYERPNIKDLVRKYIDELATKHYDLNSLEQISPTKGGPSVMPKQLKPLIDNKDRIVLMNRVMLLIKLFEAMHPYNQPTPQSLIIAVIYHAWRSLDTFKMIAVNLGSRIHSGVSKPEMQMNVNNDFEDNRFHPKTTQVKHSINFERFCQVCNLKYSSNGYKIVSKLQSSLLMLGRHLGDVNKINLPWYLKDIIENSPHLIQEHMRAEVIPENSERKAAKKGNQ